MIRISGNAKANDIIPKISWFFQLCSLYLNAETNITIGVAKRINMETKVTGNILIEAYMIKNSVTPKKAPANTIVLFMNMVLKSFFETFAIKQVKNMNNEE